MRLVPVRGNGLPLPELRGLQRAGFDPQPSGCPPDVRRPPHTQRTGRRRGQGQLGRPLRPAWSAALSAAVARRPADRHLACCCCPAGGGCCWRGGRPAGLAGDRPGSSLGCGIGAFLMRGAGCTWNDITDRDFDGRWRARARGRSPRGRSRGRRLAWMVAQALLAFLHPADLQPGRDRAGRRLALARWRSIPSPSASPGGRRSSSASPSTGARCWPGRRDRVARLAGGAALPVGHRLDAVLRHDLRPSGREDDALIGVKSTARLFGENTVTGCAGFMVAPSC
jgi:hypothetical protein